MSGHLKHELPISALVNEATGRRALHLRTAEDEWACGEAEILLRTRAILANHLDELDLAKTPSGNDQVG